jgi:hypothetical protein
MAKDRHLHHIKAFRTTTGVGKPRPNEGSNGDMTIRAIEKGLFLFVKYGNFWYRVSKLVAYDNNAPSVSTTSTSGGSGNIGVKAGSKLFLDTIKSKNGIDGQNYIESGNTASSASRGATNSDVAFMNFALDKEPILILSGGKSDGTPEKLTFKSTLNTVNGPTLHFLKTKSGASGGDNNIVGELLFSGPDKPTGTPVETQWARIVSQVSEASHPNEAGKLSFSVAASDGVDENSTELVTGLVLEGEHATGGEVDVTIGAGAASITTIAGDLDIDGDTITAVSHLNVDPAGDFIADSGRFVTLDCASGREIYLLENGGTYTPSTANCAIPKHYLDANTYHFIKCGFYSTNATKTYLPIAGNEDLREVTLTTGAGERVTFICPYNGSLEKVMVRCENICGSSIFGFHKLTGVGEVPSTTATQSVTVNMAALDTSYEFDFAAEGTNTFSKGDIIMFSFDPTNTMNDISFTIVLKFDVST